MAFNEMNIKDMLCDMYDIQRQVKQTIVKPLYNEMPLYNAPKDNEGSCITMGDCIENVIEQLEEELKRRGEEID